MKALVIILLTAAMFFKPLDPSCADTGEKDTLSKSIKTRILRSNEIVREQLLKKVNYPATFKIEVKR